MIKPTHIPTSYSSECQFILEEYELFFPTINISGSILLYGINLISTFAAFTPPPPDKYSIDNLIEDHYAIILEEPVGCNLNDAKYTQFFPLIVKTKDRRDKLLNFKKYSRSNFLLEKIYRKPKSHYQPNTQAFYVETNSGVIY